LSTPLERIEPLSARAPVGVDALTRAAFEAAADGLALLDGSAGDLSVVHANARLAATLGTATDAMLGQSLFDWTDEVGASMLRELAAAARSGRERRPIELLLRVGGGHLRRMRVTLTPLALPGPGELCLATFSDVSDLRALEAVIETLPVELMEFDRDLVVRWANAAAVRATGLPSEQVIGRCWTEVQPLAADRLEIYARVLAGEPLDFECVPMRLGDAERFYQTSLRPIRSPDGTITGLVAMGRDVTDRELARLAVDEVRRRFAAMIAATNDVIALVAGDGRLLFVSPSCESVSGFRPEALVGRQVFDLLHPDDVTQIRSRLANAPAGDTTGSQPFTVRVRHRDGHYVWVESTTSNSLGDPAVRGIVVVSRDITRRRLAEAVIAEGRERLDLALSGAAAGTWEYDVESGIHRLDGRCASILGRDARAVELDLAAIRALSHPDDFDAMLGALQRYLHGETTWYEAEYRALHADGSWRWVAARGRAVGRDAAGRVRRIAGVLLDIDARKRAERDLRTAAALLETAGADGSVALWSWDIVTGERHGTASWFAMSGYTPEQWRAEPDAWARNVHPEDLPRVMAAFERLFRAEIESIDADIEYRFRTHSGDWRWFSARARIVERDAAGHTVRIVGRTLDITAQKRMRQFLQETQQAAAVGGWELNLRTGELSWTDETYAIFETSRDQFTPSLESTMPLYRLEHHAAIRAAMDAATTRGEPFDITVECETLRGRPRWLRLIGKAELISGQAVRLYGAKQDVTELRRVDATLHTQARMLETLREGVLLIDVDGRICLANRAASDMFAVAEASMLEGRPITDFGLEARRLRRPRRPHGESMDPPIEWLARRADGSTFLAEAAVSELRGGSGTRTIAVIMDVTERRRLERAIIDVSNREQQRIGQDLHDGLGQELTGISLMLRSYAKRAAKEYPKGAQLVEEVIELVNHAVESARALAHGLSPMILERGGLPAALAHLAANATRMHGLRVRFRKSIAAPLHVDSATMHHLYRIAQEAVSNAARHSGAKVVTVRLDVGPASLRLSVSDDGRGLPPAAERVGDGLGLRIMEFRARMIHARFRIERPRRGGTRVSCRVPLT
jgi:PAS domain S-box-containing protein